MATKVKTGVIDSSAITSALIANASITADDLHTTLDLTGKTVTVSTASAGDNDTSVASTAYVDVAIANLADSAPSTLNTLNELAAALGDDANYATTTTAAIAAKLPLAGGTMTGNLRGTSFSVGAADAGEALNILDGGHTGQGATNTVSLASFAENVSGNTAGPWLGSMTNENTAVIGSRTASGNIGFQTYDGGWGERMRITNTGNVGIGTNAPDTKLHVFKATAGTITNYTDNALVVENNTDVGISLLTPNANAGHLMFGSPANQYHSYIRGGYGASTTSTLKFYTDGINTMTHKAGKVGIGTSSPTSKFHVASAPNGNIPTAHILQNAATNAPTLFIEQTGSGGNTNVNQGLLIKVDGNNGGYGNIIRAIGTNSNVNGGVDVEALVVKNDGKVGIGTDTPANKLQIGSVGSSGYGGNDLAIGDGTRVFATYISSTSDAVEFYTNRKYAFLPSGSGSTGYVGIGTASPTAYLEISAGAPTITLNASGQATNKKKVRLAASQYTAGDFNIQQMNDDGTTITLAALTVINGGRVGIGKTSPTGSLHVNTKDNSGADVHVVVQNTTANRIAGYKIQDESGNTGINLLYDNGSNAATLESPIGNLTLDVAGDITLDADGGDIVFKDGGTTFGGLKPIAVNRLSLNATAVAGYLAVAGTEYFAWNPTDIRPTVNSAYNLGVTGAAFNNIVSTGVASVGTLDSSHGLYDLVSSNPNGFAAGAAANTWYEITDVDWNNYHTGDNVHDHFCIGLFWTSGVTANGYNHRIRIYVPNFSSNVNNPYRPTPANGSYSSTHRDYDGSPSALIFASHHTGMNASGNFKFDARFTNQSTAAGNLPLRLQVKTNTPPASGTTVTMKVWRL